MYIKQALHGRHDWWLYLLGAIVIFIAWQVVGALPLGGYVALKAMQEGSFPTTMSEIIDVIGKNSFLVLSIVSFAIGLITLFLWVKYVHKFSLLKLTTSRNRIDFKRIGIGFLMVSVVNISLVLLDYWLSPGDYVFNFQLQPFLILCAIAFLLLPLQTSFEEYLFRGYLMQGLGVISKTKWWPLIVTSVIFGLMHIFNPELDKLGYLILVYYIGTGFFLGILTLMDEGMELSLGYHAGNNIIGALLITSDWSAIQTDSILVDVSDPSLGFDVFTPVFIQAIILLFFAKIFKWKGWKEKLFGNLQ
ncbi:hypothetical protein SAMN05216480_104107 [Pustulibacterium marinum]|uniref:CAAX prenyl protease 2/Lysostaphin resistance protein A-like domain-containing protein n=1 Tax=Pustulibacterium marinum TaxID=1224947 RepID=A0A1I7GCV8_9FLAO|nr:CPBP family intramembrane glutamic endopeptidase [Pustulibacterium marinum]SFU46275.1 hypothetical protein SAMN05216480_104107 [Pustulibacterium marinum]